MFHTGFLNAQHYSVLSDIAYNMEKYYSRLKAYEKIFMCVCLSSTLENRSIISAKFMAKMVGYFSLAKFPHFKVAKKSVLPLLMNKN